MKRRFVFCLGAMLFAGTLAAQTPVPEWQAGVDKVKSLIKTNPEQASDAAGELLKGKNKKNVELVTSVGPCLSGCRTAERGGNLSGDGKKSEQQGSGSFCTRG